MSAEGILRESKGRGGGRPKIGRLHPTPPASHGPEQEVTDPQTPVAKQTDGHEHALGFFIPGPNSDSDTPNSSPSDLKTTQIRRGRWANNRLKDLHPFPAPGEGLGDPFSVCQCEQLPSAPSSPRPFQASWQPWLFLRTPSTQAVPSFSEEGPCRASASFRQLSRGLQASPFHLSHASKSLHFSMMRASGAT